MCCRDSPVIMYLAPGDLVFYTLHYLHSTYIRGGRSGQKIHHLCKCTSSIQQFHQFLLSITSDLTLNLVPLYILTPPGTPTCKTFTPFRISCLLGILPRRINSADLDMTGSIPIVATATTISPLQ